MKSRSLLVALAALAALAPASVGNKTETLRGRLLPDLPEHLEYAEKDMDHGQLSDALAHVDLILMSHIHYHLNFVNVPVETQPECTAAFRDAVAMWERALGKDWDFEEAADGQPAEVQVTFQPDVQQSGAEVAGYVNWRRRVVNGTDGAPHMDMSATVFVRTIRPDGSPMLLEHMRHTSAHEMGHVLGLDDSPFYGDIMGPLDINHPVSDFEASELENLRAVRAEAVQVRDQALAKAIVSH
jgi:predicted Zn-dependent protease